MQRKKEPRDSPFLKKSCPVTGYITCYTNVRSLVRLSFVGCLLSQPLNRDLLKFSDRCDSPYTPKSTSQQSIAAKSFTGTKIIHHNFHYRAGDSASALRLSSFECFRLLLLPSPPYSPLYEDVTAMHISVAFRKVVTPLDGGSYGKPLPERRVSAMCRRLEQHLAMSPSSRR